MGRYNSPDGERLAEISAFLNLFDAEFYDTLIKYFQNTVSRAESGEFA